MRVLVIGGTLFIGRLLVARLVEAGHDVSVLHRRSGHDLGKEVGEIIADRNDSEAVERALQTGRFEIVFDNVYDWERGTTARQVEAAARSCGDRLKRYVFMSSVAVYPEGLDHREADALVPDDDLNSYARNKAMTERMLFGLHRRNGFPVVTLRPPFVYGPGNPFYREAFFWDRLHDRRPVILPGDGERLMQFVFVKDLVWACLRVTEEEAAVGRAFNIANLGPVTQTEAVLAFAKAAGTKVVLSRVSREQIEKAGGNPMGDPAYFGVYYDLPSITQSVRQAEQILGFRPTGFDAGLVETYRWYLTHHTRQAIDYHFEDALLASVRSAE